MRKLVRSLLIVLGLGCAAAILSHFTGPQASAVAPIPVQVTNPKTAPAYVDAERPARNAFGATCYIPDVDPSINEATCTLLTLSAGQEVVIETATCSALIATGNVPDVELMMTAPAFGGSGTVDLDHFLPVTRAGGDSTIEFWRFASPLHIYATTPAGSAGSIGVFFGATASASVRQNVTCSIAGYTVS